MNTKTLLENWKNYGTSLGTVPEGLVKGLEELEIGGQAKTIQTTDFSERPSVNAGKKTSQE